MGKIIKNIDPKPRPISNIQQTPQIMHNPTHPQLHASPGISALRHCVTPGDRDPVAMISHPGQPRQARRGDGAAPCAIGEVSGRKEAGGGYGEGMGLSAKLWVGVGCDGGVRRDVESAASCAPTGSNTRRPGQRKD
eukprot:1355474-Amorphochlora_amoeboformis.AAC.1